MPTEAEYRARAKKEHHINGELEIDDDAAVSSWDNSGGAYVHAWVWVDYPDDERSLCSNSSA